MAHLAPHPARLLVGLGFDGLVSVGRVGGRFAADRYDPDRALRVPLPVAPRLRAGLLCAAGARYVVGLGVRGYVAGFELGADG